MTQPEITKFISLNNTKFNKFTNVQPHVIDKQANKKLVKYTVSSKNFEHLLIVHVTQDINSEFLTLQKIKELGKF